MTGSRCQAPGLQYGISNLVISEQKLRFRHKSMLVNDAQWSSNSVHMWISIFQERVRLPKVDQATLKSNTTCINMTNSYSEVFDRLSTSLHRESVAPRQLVTCPWKAITSTDVVTSRTPSDKRALSQIIATANFLTDSLWFWEQYVNSKIDILIVSFWVLIKQGLAWDGEHIHSPIYLYNDNLDIMINKFVQSSINIWLEFYWDINFLRENMKWWT